MSWFLFPLLFLSSSSPLPLPLPLLSSPLPLPLLFLCRRFTARCRLRSWGQSPSSSRRTPCPTSPRTASINTSAARSWWWPGRCCRPRAARWPASPRPQLWVKHTNTQTHKHTNTQTHKHTSESSSVPLSPERLLLHHGYERWWKTSISEEDNFI